MECGVFICYVLGEGELTANAEGGLTIKEQAGGPFGILSFV